MTSPNFINSATSPFALSTLSGVSPAETSLSIDATVWLGQNKVRRVGAKTANVFLGDNNNAQNLTLGAGSTGAPTMLNTAFSSPTSMMVLTVSSPIQVYLTIGVSTLQMTVNQLLMIDSGVAALVLSNSSAAPVYAQLLTVTSGTPSSGAVSTGGVVVQTSEALTAGSFVNLYASGADTLARNAIATGGKDADGFVLRSFDSGARATVFPLDGINSSLSGLVAGTAYFLSQTTPGVVVTGDALIGTPGWTAQQLGVALNPTDLSTDDYSVVTYA